MLRERVFRPIGVADADWSAGYGKTYAVDGLPLVACWGGAAFTPRAAARTGRLVLRQGDWDGLRLLSPDAVRQMTGDAGLPGHCGMGWWSNRGAALLEVADGRRMGRGSGRPALAGRAEPELNHGAQW